MEVTWTKKNPGNLYRLDLMKRGPESMVVSPVT